VTSAGQRTPAFIVDRSWRCDLRLCAFGPHPRGGQASRGAQTHQGRDRERRQSPDEHDQRRRALVV
jgi:hypothetical protein